MIAYLDTQIVVWLCEERLNKLSKAARREVNRADLLISPLVLLELQYLEEIGRTRRSPLSILMQLESQLGLTVCNRSFPPIIETSLYESWTHDPFDRVIVAHAKAADYSPLVTSDSAIRDHYTATVW